MISRRQVVLALGAGALAAPFASLAQTRPALGVRRIGFLSARSRSTPTDPDVLFDAFVQGMRELGYVERKNLVIEWRFAEGKYDRLPALAAELVQLKPDLIVTDTTPGTQALQRATGSIPVVMTAIGDPVGSGFAASLARPGGNITGLSVMTIDVGPKQLELLKLIVPALSAVAVLVNPGTTFHVANLKSIQAAAQQIGVKVQPVNARTAEEIESGFAAMKRGYANGVIILGDAFFIAQRRQITELAARNRLPSLFLFQEDAAAGGLMSYGPSLGDLFRRAAAYVDKILKGAKPGDLPVEQPTVFELVINLKTVNALGLKIPQSLLQRADRVIE